MDKSTINESIDNIFSALQEKADKMLNVSENLNEITQNIIHVVSEELTTQSRTLIVDLYSVLSQETLNQPEFQDMEHKSMFYLADIRGLIYDKYVFDETVMESLQEGISVQEINKTYTSIAAAAGTAAVGGVLKYVLSTRVNIPIVLIFIGAMTAFCISYFKVTPEINKTSFHKAVSIFLKEIRNEYKVWFEEIEQYYHQKVQELIETF